MKKKEEIILQFQNSSIPSKRVYKELDSSFWDTENIINKKYKAKKETIPPKNTELLQLIEFAIDTIQNSELKSQYLHRLFFQYISSQPNSLYQLSSKYNSIVYPYFMFSLNSPDYHYVIINFIDFTIEIYSEKNEIIRSIEIESILKIQKDEDGIIIMVPEEKNNIIVLPPEVTQQVNLLYVLIMFMGQINERNKSLKSQKTIVQEVNQNLIYKEHDSITNEKVVIEEKFDISKLKLLDNDMFVPKGIKLSSYVFLDKAKKNNEYDRFITLGISFLIIFKDETMSLMLKIIPIFSSYVIFDYNPKTMNIIVKTKKENISLFFPNEAAFNLFKETIEDIKEGKCKEEITLDDLENICFKSVNNSIESNITEETVINSLAYHRTVEEIEELEAKLQAMTLRKELLNTFIKEKEDDEMKSKRIAEMKAKK